MKEKQGDSNLSEALADRRQAADPEWGKMNEEKNSKK